MTAFRLGNAKALVPMVFVYSPSLLLVVDSFTWHDFFVAFIGCVVGVMSLGAALTGYMLAPMPYWQRGLLAAAAIMLIAPGIKSGLVGLGLALPVVVLQLLARKRVREAPLLAEHQIPRSSE